MPQPQLAVLLLFSGLSATGIPSYAEIAVSELPRLTLQFVPGTLFPLALPPPESLANPLTVYLKQQILMQELIAERVTSATTHTHLLPLPCTRWPREHR